jgi:hypothetical protein
VKGAFAALGLDLHIAARRASGLVFLVNNARVGPEHLPRPPRVVTVLVATRRRAADSMLFRGRYAHVTRYANVTAFSRADPYALDEVRGAVSALRWGLPGRTKRGRRLIVPGDSIGAIWLWESRTSVEKAIGPGRSVQRGLVSYLGGRVLVDYRFHDRIYSRVQYLRTRSRTYHTPSGIHVGSSRNELRALYVSCTRGTCLLQAGPWPDPPGTIFTIANGKVVEITVGSLG